MIYIILIMQKFNLDKIKSKIIKKISFKKSNLSAEYIIVYGIFIKNLSYCVNPIK